MNRLFPLYGVSVHVSDVFSPGMGCFVAFLGVSIISVDAPLRDKLSMSHG